MNEQFCPHCGKTMVNPIGQMFYCPDECDLRVANAGSKEIPNEREFQIGDRVRVYRKLDGDNSYEIGNILHIVRTYISINNSQCAECTSEDDDVYLHVYLEELEHCPGRKPGEFRQGDKVRVCKKLTYSPFYKIDDIYYIFDADSNGDIKIAKSKEEVNNGHYHCHTLSKELELIEEAP